MAVGTDGDGAPRPQEIDRRKDAVAQIGLGHRAQAGDGMGLGQPPRLLRRHVGGVDRRPPPGKRETVQKHLHGALS